MKSFKNLTTSIPKPEGGNYSYADLVLICSTSVDPNVGVTIDGMRRALRVVNAVESQKHEESISLEDHDYEFLKSKMKDFKWAFTHQDIADMYDRIQ